jgi:hypothetical protein
VTSDAPSPPPAESGAPAAFPVFLTRTPRGWSVNSPAGSEEVPELIEGLSLADLVAEELGARVEPDRTARRSARGPSGAAEAVADPADARVAELERTVAQLEHALASRVSTERAIGVLAERHGISARSAFESLRGDARSQGRPVAELAREVLDGLGAETPTSAVDQRTVPAPAPRHPGAIVVAVPPPTPRGRPRNRSVGAADGRS